MYSVGKKLLNVLHNGYIHVRENPIGSQMIITIENHTVDRLRLVGCESGGYGEEHGENTRNMDRKSNQSRGDNERRCACNDITHQ